MLQQLMIGSFIFLMIATINVLIKRNRDSLTYVFIAAGVLVLMTIANMVKMYQAGAL